MSYCNFNSNKSVQTGSESFQKPIRHNTFHFQQRSRAVLLQNKNCSRTSVSSVNRSPIRYTFASLHFTILYSVNNIFGLFTWSRGNSSTPGVNFASVHGLELSLFIWGLRSGQLREAGYRCTTPGNPSCWGNFSQCEQTDATVAPWQE